MAMTPEQITAELQRKKNAGIMPTSQANNSQYNQLASTQTPKTQPTQPYTPTFNAYGGKDNYAAGQNDRWQQANQNNDQDLMSRLMADSKRAGYTLNPYTANTNSNSNTSSNDLLSRLNEVMNKQTMKELPQFNYDPNSDPQYQAALNRAKSNSETASGNAMAELNKRGILNSTITGDRLGQIEQSEYGRVSDTILPQLMEQAYGRHRDTVGDQYRAGRDEISDLANLLGMTSDLDQRGLDNAFRDKSFNRGVLESDRGFNRGVLESDRGFNRGVLESDRSYEYTQGRDKVSDDRWQTEFDQRVKQDGIQNALAWANNAISKQNADRLSSGGSSGGSSDKPANLNTAITNINKLYTKYDSSTGSRSITNPTAVKSYIDSMGLPEDQKQQLYSYYGVSGGNSGGNFWDALKGAIGGVAKAVNSSGSVVSDDDINKYLK